MPMPLTHGNHIGVTVVSATAAIFDLISDRDLLLLLYDTLAHDFFDEGSGRS